ncbi:MAG: hypothetical protein ACLS67_22205 [Anaerobutyricum soehngenii]
MYKSSYVAKVANTEAKLPKGGGAGSKDCEKAAKRVDRYQRLKAAKKATKAAKMQFEKQLRQMKQNKLQRGSQRCYQEGDRGCRE